MPFITGTYSFSPPLDAAGNRVRRDGSTTDWWLIIRCDADIGRYFRSLYAADARRVRTIGDPLWGPHVSVVQNEIPADLSAWKDREGREVVFEYSYPPREIGDYVFFDVVCAEALDYRERLGLPREPKWPLHLTIGNRK